MDPVEDPVPKVLDYILSLKEKGLAFSFLKVHLAAITAYHALIFTISLLILHSDKISHGLLRS